MYYMYYMWTSHVTSPALTSYTNSLPRPSLPLMMKSPRSHLAERNPSRNPWHRAEESEIQTERSCVIDKVGYSPPVVLWEEDSDSDSDRSEDEDFSALTV